MEPTQQIREKIDLVSFISEFVTLKKAGRNFKGLCPFHNESTPSFMVSPERQIWHCFGCQKGGDVFSFLMEYEKMEFPEALRTLAQRVGVELPRDRFTFPNSSKKEELYEMNKKAANLYHYLLIQHKIGSKAKAYVDGREITEKVAKTYLLGFAPSSETTLVDYMIKKHHYSTDDLLEAGLATQGRGKVIDFFRGRLIFPLIDHRENVVGFAGRVLDAGDNFKAKYINTRDTLVYHKGESVFGLNIAKEPIRKANQAILVEGEFDVMSCFQHGITNVVAIKGTALTESQVMLLGRFAQKITICFDEDTAGQNALVRSLPLLEKKGLTTTVILLPDGKDPDEALKTSEAAFKKAVDHDIPVYDYLLMREVKQFDPTTLEGKREISSKLLPLISNISNEIIKEHYLRKLSSELDTSLESLQKEEEKLRRKDKPIITPATSEKRPREEVLEEYLLALLLQSDRLSEAFSQIYNTLRSVMPKDRAYQKIFYHIASFLKQHETVEMDSFAKGLPEALRKSFGITLLLPLPTFSTSDEQLGEITKTAHQLRSLYLRQKLKLISQEIKAREKDGEEEVIEKLREEFSALATMLKK